jgi:hypothetical protein
MARSGGRYDSVFRQCRDAATHSIVAAILGELMVAVAIASGLARRSRRRHRPCTSPVYRGGIAAGYGVLSHELGFVGQLARRLAVLSGRAIDIQVSAGMTARVCTQQLASTSLSRFDAIVLVIGSVEALELRSTRSGRKDIAGLLDTAREYAPPKTEIFILSIPIVGEATGFPAVLTSLVAHQSRQCSAITADLAAAVPHTSVIAIDQVEALSFPGTASGERWASIAQTSSTCRWRLSPSLTKTGSG